MEHQWLVRQIRSTTRLSRPSIARTNQPTTPTLLTETTPAINSSMYDTPQREVATVTRSRREATTERGRTRKTSSPESPRKERRRLAFAESDNSNESDVVRHVRKGSSRRRDRQTSSSESNGRKKSSSKDVPRHERARESARRRKRPTRKKPVRRNETVTSSSPE